MIAALHESRARPQTSLWQLEFHKALTEQEALEILVNIGRLFDVRMGTDP